MEGQPRTTSSYNHDHSDNESSELSPRPGLKAEDGVHDPQTESQAEGLAAEVQAIQEESSSTDSQKHTITDDVSDKQRTEADSALQSNMSELGESESNADSEGAEEEGSHSQAPSLDERPQDQTGLVDSQGESLKVITTDVTIDTHQAALDFANKRLTEELNSDAGFLRRTVRRIWKGNIAKEYYRARYAREAESIMREQGNFLSPDATPEEVSHAKAKLFERFGLELDEAIHFEAGESREELSQDSEFVQGSKEVIKKYVEANGEEFNQAALKQELNRLLKEQGQVRGGDVLQISNLATIAEAVKDRVAHGQALENVLENIQFISGEARTGVRTDMERTTTDRIYEKIRKRGLGRAVAPETLLVASSVAASLAGLGGRKLTATALTLVPGAAGAVIAGYRENKRTKEDRIQHMREMAQGGEIEDESRRRQQMEEVRYETETALSLTEELNQYIDNLQEAENGFAADTVRDALIALSDINARISLSDKRGIDLVSFSSQEAIGDERLDLDIARAKLRKLLEGVSLDNIHMEGADKDMRDFFSGDTPMKEIIAQEQAFGVEVIEEDISNKDKAFKKLKARRIAKAAAVGGLGGLTFGLVSQEIMASFTATQGVFEGAGPANGGHQTLLASWIHGDKPIIPTGYSGNLIEETMPDGSKMNIPEGASLRTGVDGAWRIVDADGQELLNSSAIDSDGNFDPAVLAALKEQGFSLEEAHRTLTIPGVMESHEVSYGDPGEYVRANGGVEISGRSWADNGTLAFDQNELRTWSLPVGQDGSVNYTIENMTADGSFGQGGSANWMEEVQSGNMVALVTGSRGSQNYAFEVPIDASGHVSISPDNPAYQFFEVDAEGNSHLKGAFLEIAVKEPQPDDTINAYVLGTEVGENNIGTITQAVTEKAPDTFREVVDHTIVPPTERVVSLHTEMAPAIPITGRAAMETLRRREKIARVLEPAPNSPESAPSGGEYYYYGDGGAIDQEKKEAWERDLSPRLREDNGAKLLLGEELDWHRSVMERRNGERYVHQVDEAAKLEGITNNEELKSIITIPVHATGEAESENIYNLLQAYSEQDSAEAIESTAILLHVNYMSDEMNDPERAQRVNKTLAAIQRAKEDYPHLKIESFLTVYDRDEVKDGAIGHVAQRLQDVALSALRQGIQKGTIRPDAEVSIIRNDADAKGMSRSYMRRMQHELNKYEETDIFSGLISFDTTKIGNPALRMALDFMRSFTVLEQSTIKRNGQVIHSPEVRTEGINFAVRASALAAVGGIDVSEYSGAASDDIEVGRKIRYARLGDVVGSGAGYYGNDVSAGNKESVQNTDQIQRVVQRVVGGATIDSDSDREEKMWYKRVPIVFTWHREHGFDKDGYQDRNADLDTLRDNAPRTIDEDIDQLERDMCMRIRFSGMNVLTDYALNLFFRRASADGVDPVQCYQLSTGMEDGSEQIQFKLTPAGRSYIKKWMEESELRDKNNTRKVPYDEYRYRRVYGPRRAQLNQVA